MSDMSAAVHRAEDDATTNLSEVEPPVDSAASALSGGSCTGDPWFFTRYLFD